ncbi:MAG: ATP-dependent DNA helicase RecG, partial [Oscillospiraceae bacterium]
MDFLTCDIRFLKGVGEKRALGLNRLGVYTVKDLLYLFPRRYIDYSAPVEVAFAPYDQPCVVKATVISCGGGIRINGGKTLFRVVCADDTARLNITFFNAEYTVKRLEVGKDYLFYGKFSGGMLVREVTSPTFISADSGVKQQPIYPLTAGISSAMLGKYVAAALEQISEIPDFMPPEILQECQLCSLDFALRAIHSAKSCEDLIAAKSRLIFDEFFILQLGISLMGENERRKTQVIVPHTDLTPLLESLPFAPTGAQLRATQEIFADFAAGMGMNRLLQGDVGSGKTLVAVFTMYAMANSGYQSCLMAPTEILAAQHYTTVTNLLKGHNIRVALLTAGVKAKERREILDGLARGEIDILIGTHSVISDSVIFKNLGFCITDEQHRFGVLQRIAVSKKGDNPHILVMSATPIPRTLSMIIYGNMQLSILDEVPMGRKPIETFLVGTDKRARMFGFIAKQVAMGGQAYIVLPAIEDSENMSDLQSVTTYYEEVIKPLLPNVSAEILHGKLKAKEK